MPPASSVVELAGKTLSLIAILLPAIGAGVRFVAFQFTEDVRPSLLLTIESSVAELVGTGILALFPALVFLPVAYILLMPHFRIWRAASQIDSAIQEHAELTRLAGLREKLRADPQTSLTESSLLRLREIDEYEASTGGTLEAHISEMEVQIASLRTTREEIGQALSQPFWHHLVGRTRRQRIVAAVWYLAISVPFVLLTENFPAAVFWFLGPIGATLWLYRELHQRGQLAFARTWPAVLWLGLACMLAGGLNGNIVGVASGYYSFSDEGSVLTNGVFARVGEHGTLEYLVGCPEESDRPALAVPLDAIEFVDYGRDLPPEIDGPSLLEFVTQGDDLDVGLHFRC